MVKKKWLYPCLGAIIAVLIISAAILGCGEGEEDARSLTLERDEWEEGKSMPDETLPVSIEEAGANEQLGAVSETEAVGDITSDLAQLQLKVIKNALLEMEAGKGDYVRIKNDALARAAASGGFVESESSSRDDEGYTYGTLTLRVPADKFDEVLSDLSGLGEVISTQVSTSDVSGEYVDLESRLVHLEAEEAFYMALIAEAQTIQDMISIREHLSSIQLEKERIQGRKNFLDQQIDFSTITCSVEEVSPDDGEGFWGSVKEAFKSFARGLKALAIGLFYALPYLIIMALVLLVIWLLVRRSRRAKSPEGERFPGGGQ